MAIISIELSLDIIRTAQRAKILLPAPIAPLLVYTSLTTPKPNINKLLFIVMKQL
jgi:hypothetical protein